MKLADFETVTKLIRVKENCESALIAAGHFYDSATTVDAGGVPGFDIGWRGYISKESDGSGDSINLNGCYVIGDVVKATMGVIEAQIRRVNQTLKELGVDVD